MKYRTPKRLKMMQPIKLNNTVIAYLWAGLLISASFFSNYVRAEGVTWDSLSLQQQQTLASFKDQWNTLPSQRQTRLSKGAEKWAAMDPKQRELMRTQLNRFKNLSPEDKALVKERIHLFKELPPEKRNALRKRWKNMSPEKNKDFVIT